MKKFIFTILLFFSTSFSFSQSSTYYSTFVKKATWSEYQQKFIWNDGNKTNLKIVMLDNFIRIYDDAESYYVLKGDEKKSKKIEYEMSTWDANDERGRRVKVSIIHYFDDDTVVLMVMYEDIAFAYTVTSQGLSPLNN
jgi:hypothetical protein